jgi:uncharacterized protein with HEPN domain
VASGERLRRHEYFRIDIKRILEVVKRDLAPLEQGIDKLLEE